MNDQEWARATMSDASQTCMMQKVKLTFIPTVRVEEKVGKQQQTTEVP